MLYVSRKYSNISVISSVNLVDRKEDYDEPQASVFLRFPKVEQHPKCMDHAILHGKPFSNCFIK